MKTRTTTLITILVLAAVIGALACGGKKSDGDPGAAGGKNQALDIWWTKTGGGKSTLAAFRLGKDGSYQDEAGQQGTYTWSGKTLAIKVGDKTGQQWEYQVVSASATELKVQFLGVDYVFSPRP